MHTNSPKKTISQVVTRSNSTKASTSSPTPLSVVDFHITMDEIRKTQEETLGQCKLLSESQTLKFAELKNSISQLTTQVVDLKNENGVLRSNINDLNKRVHALELTNNSNPTSTVDIVPTLLQEISDRERFSRNVIIRGIPESTSSALADRITSDTSRITEAIQPYFPALPTSIKSIRLGKPSDRGPRPLKVFLPSKEVALKLIADFNIGVRDLPADSSARSISVIRDRTPREREFIRSIYADLDNRRKNGEANIMVKYRDGIPSIVPISSSSQASRPYSSVIKSKN